MKSELHVYATGGLGNQLLQFSSAKRLADVHNQKLVIREDLLPEHPDTLHGVSRWPLQIRNLSGDIEIRKVRNQPPRGTNLVSKVQTLKKLIASRAPSLLLRIGSISSDAVSSAELLRRSYREINTTAFFRDLIYPMRDELRSLLTGAGHSQGFRKLRESIQGTRVLAIHFRQGDYLHLAVEYGNLGINYYEQAAKKLGRTATFDEIWIFTDTHNEQALRLQNRIGATTIVGPAELSQPIETLILMSEAAGFIASNSTLSWWSVFLGDANRPMVAPKPGTAQHLNFVDDDCVENNLELLNC